MIRSAPERSPSERTSVMSVDPCGTPPLFVPPPARELHLPANRPAGTVAGKWTKHRPVKPHKCDLCMAVLIEAKGHGPAAHPARWRRVAGAVDEFLCYGHAQLRREQTGESGGGR